MWNVGLMGNACAMPKQRKRWSTNRESIAVTDPTKVGRQVTPAWESAAAPQETRSLGNRFLSRLHQPAARHLAKRNEHGLQILMNKKM